MKSDSSVQSMEMNDLAAARRQHIFLAFHGISVIFESRRVTNIYKRYVIK